MKLGVGFFFAHFIGGKGGGGEGGTHTDISITHCLGCLVPIIFASIEEEEEEEEEKVFFLLFSPELF